MLLILISTTKCTAYRASNHSNGAADSAAICSTICSTICTANRATISPTDRHIIA